MVKIPRIILQISSYDNVYLTKVKLFVNCLFIDILDNCDYLSMTL